MSPVLSALAAAPGVVLRSAVGWPLVRPPVDPDRQEARKWAVDELAKPVYREAQPDWLTDLWRQFTEWLRSLSTGDAGIDSGVAVPAIGVTIAILVAVAIILARPRLNARRRTAAEIVDADPAITPAEYRRRAEAAAARSDWRTAVVEQFRAVVRSAEDRTVIDPQPGRTADEVAGQLAAAFGAQAGGLLQAAGLFDAIRYGSAAASARDYGAIVALDQLLESAKPDFAGKAADRLALPT